MGSTQRYIKCFDSLRAIAIFSIFLSHLAYLEGTNMESLFHCVSYARLGVDFFFVLSGFVLAMGYQKRFADQVTKKDWSSFVKKRISKIYIPYIICLLIGMVRYIVLNHETVTLKNLAFRSVISIPLLQSSVPFGDYTHSFNGVAWFISCIFIFYLITPFLLRANRHIKNNKTLTTVSLFILLLFGAVYMLFRYLQYYRFESLNLSLVYSTPYIRIFPFCIGILLYDYYVVFNSGKCIESLGKYATLLEAVAAVANLTWWVYATNTKLPMVLQEEISIILSGILIIVFAL